MGPSYNKAICIQVTPPHIFFHHASWSKILGLLIVIKQKEQSVTIYFSKYGTKLEEYLSKSFWNLTITSDSQVKIPNSYCYYAYFSPCFALCKTKQIITGNFILWRIHWKDTILVHSLKQWGSIWYNWYLTHPC